MLCKPCLLISSWMPRGLVVKHSDWNPGVLESIPNHVRFRVGRHHFTGFSCCLLFPYSTKYCKYHQTGISIASSCLAVVFRDAVASTMLHTTPCIIRFLKYLVSNPQNTRFFLLQASFHTCPCYDIIIDLRRLLHTNRGNNTSCRCTPSVLQY